MTMNSLFKHLFWRQGKAVCWSMNAEHWICNLLFVVLALQNHKDQRNLNRKLFYGPSVLMVYFFLAVIHSCPLCQSFSTFSSARTIYPREKPSRDCLVQPCHSGFHLLKCKIWFNWKQPCITLTFSLSILPACWMGVCVQCWVSCAFFLFGVWVSCNCGAQALGREALLNISY